MVIILQCFRVILRVSCV